jgi:hypothetical protein
MQLTLEQLFGVNAVQDSQLFSINKADLPLLTPSANNTAESLLAALLLKAFENFQGQLTDPNANKITDPQGNSITYDNSKLYDLLLIEPWDSFLKERNNSLYVTDTLIIHQFSPYADTEFP